MEPANPAARLLSNFEGTDWDAPPMIIPIKCHNDHWDAVAMTSFPNPSMIMEFADHVSQPGYPSYMDIIKEKLSGSPLPPGMTYEQAVEASRAEGVAFMFESFCREAEKLNALPVGDGPDDYEARLMVIVTPGRGRHVAQLRRDSGEMHNVPVDNAVLPDGCLEALDRICVHIVRS